MPGPIQLIFFDLGDTLVTAPRTWLPGAQALLGSLKQKGIKLGIISNTAGLSDRQAILNLLPSDFDLDLFEPTAVLFSSEVGIEKPNKEIFEKALAGTTIPSSQCLYCSENLVETLVAQHVGLRSARVQAPPNSDVGTIEQVLTRFHSLIR